MFHKKCVPIHSLLGMCLCVNVRVQSLFTPSTTVAHADILRMGKSNEDSFFFSFFFEQQEKEKKNREI